MEMKEATSWSHFQIPPHGQAKLVRVTTGRVLDVVVDLRKSQSTFGESFSIELSAEKKNMLFIPAGFAHGFLTLDAVNVFSYKCSGYYSQIHERGLRWNDSELNIDWPTAAPLVSKKDSNALNFSEFDSPF
jgi:dTDP-4-dehydrorhamnose 3,5-epimerase